MFDETVHQKYSINWILGYTKKNYYEIQLIIYFKMKNKINDRQNKVENWKND